MAITDDITGYNFADPFRHFNNNQNFVDQAQQFEGTNLAKAPWEAFNAFGQIAKEGVYGQGGVQNILQQVSNASASRRQMLGRGLRASAGRRLGPRSGAIDTIIANKVTAPEFANLSEMGANLTARNLESRSSTGLQGILATLQFLQNRYGNKWWEAAEKDGFGGFLDTLKAITSIGSNVASLIPGPQQPVALAASAAQGKEWA